MNKIIQSVQISLNGLSEKDKRALVGLSAFFIILLLYGLFSSAASYQQQGIDHLFDVKEDRTFFYEAVHRINRHKKNPTKLEGLNDSLLSVVSSSAKELSLNLKRIKPTGDANLEVQLERVNFNHFMVWLQRLEGRYGVLVEELSVDKSSEGQADIRLNLIR